MQNYKKMLRKHRASITLDFKTTIITIQISAMPDKDENGTVIEDEFSDLPFPSQYFARWAD